MTHGTRNPPPDANVQRGVARANRHRTDPGLRCARRPVIPFLLPFLTLTLFSLAIGLLQGALLAWVWRLAHGLERSRPARRWILAGLSTLHVGLWAAVLVGTRVEDSSWFVIGCALAWSTAVQLLTAAQVLTPTPQGLPERPPTFEQDHDSVSVTLPARSVGPSLAIVALTPVLFVLTPALGALYHRLVRPSVTLRVHPHHVEIHHGNARHDLVLHGLTVEQHVSVAGTPHLVLSQGDQIVRIPVGGAAPAHVAWVHELLSWRSSRAEPPEPVPEPPDALRGLRARAQASPDPS